MIGIRRGIFPSGQNGLGRLLRMLRNSKGGTRMTIDRRVLLRGGGALAGTMMAGTTLFGFTAPARAETDTLTLYNGQHRATTDALVAAFTKATGIKIVTRNAESP